MLKEQVFLSDSHSLKLQNSNLINHQEPCISLSLIFFFTITNETAKGEWCQWNKTRLIIIIITQKKKKLTCTRGISDCDCIVADMFANCNKEEKH